MVEQHHLVLELQARVVRAEKLRVLLLELGPDERGEARVDPRARLEREDGLALRHVELEAALDEVLDRLLLRIGFAKW